VNLRDADPLRDAARCADIYAPYVRDSATSFEYEPPSPSEIARRMRAAHVWLLAEVDGHVAGYAYGSPHRERAAYGWAADVTVYVDRDHHRAGVGRALYGALFERLREAGLWTLCAGITQPNPASSGLHEAMGFTTVGTYRRIGFKHGAWHDVTWWQLDLHPDQPGSPRMPAPGA
jgi:L-amino acid N-acyltransferase YncA